MARCRLVAVVLVLIGAVAAQTTYDIYRARPGDTAESIAERYDLPVAELIELNPFLGTRAPAEHELITVRIRRDEPVPDAPTVGGGANGTGGIRGPRLLDAQGNPIGRPQRGGQAQQAPAGPAVEQPTQTREVYATATTVGRLGMTTEDNLGIYRYENGETTELYRCPRNTRLVVAERRGQWYGVVMADRNLGWVDAAKVVLTETSLVPSQSAGNPRGEAIVRKAFEYLGVPYRWGGNGRGGIDCSGLVQQSYRSQGQSLPRVSRDQATVGQAVPWDQLQIGDRLYFASSGNRIDHTALYIGNGQFIHASGRRRLVCVDNLYNPRYWSIFVGARR